MSCLVHHLPSSPSFQYHFQLQLFPRISLEFRVYKRRRLKCNRPDYIHHQRGFVIRNQFTGPFDNNLFHNLLSQFPSVNSLDLVAPALGFASGLVVYQFSLNNSLSRRTSSNNVHDLGEWILFASPTPFNRFVTLRCPSIHFGKEADANDKLVKEDTHFVRVNTGRIVNTHFQNVADNENDALMQYQRVCVATDDGGVISLDWPAHLELEKEHGLDTTLLLVPGTPEGSEDWSVQALASDCLKRGYFPVIMNPRGCAGSPLTTPRIFTAADSDDICTAINFINRKRQWTILMSVGWGYGANMLTKYLAEVEEKTPLTAATCIDNPFDLEEATRYSTYLDEKLTGGFKDILISNKELFQGRKKGFDVEKGLLANSVRDFDAAISMISHGSDELQDFYSKSSTRSVVGNIKIPVLFIQNEDRSLPIFSIPRNSIAENQFTSLLLCTCSPSNVIASGRSVMSWCQNLSIEWLAAVELGLLKRRHPIRKDVDVNINSLKGLTLLKEGLSDKETKFREIPSFTEKSLSHRNFADFMRLEEGDTLMIGGNIQKKSEFDASLTSPFDSQLVEEDGNSLEESERGKVLQTAQVVMNMLDLTMPSALTEEEKKKVLSAVGRGESVMKALQDAVPEDVRGKLTTAVSGILKTQGTGSYLDRFLRTGHTPNVSSSTKLLSEEKVVEQSGTDSLIADSHPQDQRSKDANPKDAIDKNLLGHNHSLEPELKSVQTSNQSQSFSNVEDVNSRKDNISVTDDIFKDDTSQRANYNTDGSASHDSQSPPGKSAGTEEGNTNVYLVNQDKETAQLAAEQEKTSQNLEEINMDSSTGQNNTSSPSETKEASCSPDSQAEGSHNQKKEDKGAQTVLDHVSNQPEISSPTFSVSQALDALTGMDDSTQVAVNSVFGVIEDMITHFEEGKGNENDGNPKTDNNDEETLRRLDNHAVESKISNALHDTPAHNCAGNHTQSLEEKNTKNKAPSDNVSPIIETNNDFSQGNNVGRLTGMINHGSKEGLVGAELLFRDSNEQSSKTVPSDLSTNSYNYSLYNDSFHRYLLSKVPDRKSLDLDLTASLLLDYFPEDGQWKLLEQSSSSDTSGSAIDSEGADGQARCSVVKSSIEDEIIEPAYIILDNEQLQRAVGDSDMVDKIHQLAEVKDGQLDRLMDFVKNDVMDSLQVEVSRKLGAEEIKGNLAGDLEYVSKAVSLAVQYGTVRSLSLEVSEIVPVQKSGKAVTLHGEYIITAVSSALQKTTYLREILPLGVVVGSCLDALRKFFNVAMEEENTQKESLILDQVERFSLKSRGLVNKKKQDEKSNGDVQGTISDCSVSKESGEGALKNLKNDSIMVGAVTAALGASAVFAHQQERHYSNETTGRLPESSNDRRIYQKNPEKLEDELSENNQNNVVASLAEKALSVAAPVVPTKEGGEVDQDRLVAMLADLGQKGGILRLVGKIALLWGGIRGAVSLTDKLISFLRISERPLFQRVVGFVCMVLLLWSPVVVPLLPSLMQSWTMHNSSGIAEFCCIIGLYVAVIILVTLWGKRIRGFEKSLEQYGLVVSWPKVQDFLKAFAGGALIVLSVQSVNTFLGFARLSWQTSLHPSTVDIMTWMKVYGKIITLAGRSIVTATAMAVVEELLFRSWLPEEISVDHGYHFGIVLSGLAFSLSQRSPQAIPGLWFLSLALAGARQKSQGDLSIPIGLHAGITATSYILQMGGFLTYRPNFSLWVTGTHPFQPFSGIVGLAFSFLMAIILYPRHPLQHRKKAMRPIRE